MQINHDSETLSKNVIWNTEVEVITWKIVASNIKVEYILEINKLKYWSGNLIEILKLEKLNRNIDR